MNGDHDKVDERLAQQRLTQRSREVFDDAVANLDGHTRSRLNQARQAALQAAQGPAANTQRWLIPAGSAAVLALATVVTVQFWHGSPQSLDPAGIQTEQAAHVEDFEIVTADADLDMLKDMDFYAWLETQDLNAANASEEG